MVEPEFLAVSTSFMAFLYTIAQYYGRNRPVQFTNVVPNHYIADRNRDSRAKICPKSWDLLTLRELFSALQSLIIAAPD